MLDPKPGHELAPNVSIWIHMDPGQIARIQPHSRISSGCSPTSRDFLWIYSPRQHRIGLSVQRFSNIIQYLVIEVEWVYTWRLVGTVSKNAGQENCSGSVPWHPGDHSTVISNQIVGLFGDPCLFGIRIRGFPKMLLPPNHPNFNNFNRILHYKPSSSWGAPMMETSISVENSTVSSNGAHPWEKAWKKPGCVDSIRKRNVLGRSKASMFVVELPFWSCSTRVLQCFVVINNPHCVNYIYIHTHIHTHIIVHEICV